MRSVNKIRTILIDILLLLCSIYVSNSVEDYHPYATEIMLIHIAICILINIEVLIFYVSKFIKKLKR